MPITLHRLLFCLAFFAACARAATLNVGPSQPYTTIQSAINAAAPGDTVRVAPGTYYENIDFKGKAITVTSSAGPATTIIDGGGRIGAGVVSFVSGETRSSIISGMTLRNGGPAAYGAFPDNSSGVFVYNSSPSILNNTITANFCNGVASYQSSPLIQGNNINNTIGMTNQACLFSKGAAIEFEGHGLNLPPDIVPTVAGNTIENNTQGIYGETGGIYLHGGDTTVIRNNVFRGNTGTGAGAIVFQGSTLTILQNLFYQNVGGDTGAISIQLPGESPGPFLGIIAGNTIADNTVTGGNNFAGDIPATQLYFSGGLGQFVLVNNIIVNNRAASAAITCDVTYASLTYTALSFDHNDIVAGPGVSVEGSCLDPTGSYGNISADPLFASPASGNYHLLPGSPAIDSGNNSAPQLPPTDLAGVPRVQDATGKGYPTVDMGAYESAGLQDAATTILTLTPSRYFDSLGYIFNQTPLTFTVALSSAAGIPTGTVTIFQDGALYGTVQVGPSGVATFAGTITPGLHSYVATYPGAGAFPPAASVRFYLRIPLTPATITLASSPNPSTFGSPVTFTLHAASLDSYLPSPLTLADSSTGATLATLTPDSSGNASFTNSTLSVGLHSITASWPGDSSHTAANASVLQTVLAGSPTTTRLTCTPASIPVGSSAILTAAISASTGTPTGSITFADNSTTLATISLTGSSITLPYTGLSAGLHTLTATYIPTGSFAASSATCTETVVGLPTAATLTASPTSAAYGSPVTLTAIIASVPASPTLPTGTITFFSGASPLGTAPLTSGSASFTSTNISPGTNPISCSYSGDATFAASSCNIVPVTITAASTALTLSSSANPAFALTPVTFTLHLSSSGTALPAVPVTLTLTGRSSITAPLVTDSAGNAAYSTSALDTGAYTVSASFPGSPARASSSAALSQTVAINPTAITVASVPNPSYQGQAVTFTATVGTTPGVPLTGYVLFSDGSLPLGTVMMSTAGIANFTTPSLAAGTHNITAALVGNVDLLSSTSASLQQVVEVSDFALTSDPPSLTLATGHHTTFTLNAVSMGLFADTLELSAGNLPLHVTLVPKPLGALTVGAHASATVYLDTDDVIGYLSQTRPFQSGSRRLASLAGLPSLAVLVLLRRRRLRLPVWLALILAAATLGTATGCSGKYPASTAPGAYTLQITATGHNTGRTHVMSIPLTVTD